MYVYIQCYYFISAVVAPVVNVSSTMSNSITLTWTVPGPEVESYDVSWERDTSGECPNGDSNSTSVSGGSASYTITGLQEDSTYTITVTATNTAGSAVSVPVTAVTGEAGEGLVTCYE